MTRLCLFAAVTLLASGCRSTGDRYSANSSPQAAPGVLVQMRDSEEAPPSPSDSSTIRPVVHMEVPRVDEPPEPVPTPPSEETPISNITLVDLEQMALQSNPVLAQAVARVDAARGHWVQVGLKPNPRLGFSGQQIGSHGFGEQMGVYLGQEVVTANKLQLQRSAAAWEVDRAERELDGTRFRVLTDVRVGYYDVLIAQRRRELAAELVRIGQQGEKAANALFAGQEVSRADPLRARIEAETARIFSQNAVNQHVEAWRRLAAVLGMPTLPLQRLQGELKPDELNMSWEEELQRILSNSPEIAAAIADVEASRWSIERAYAEVVPNIDVEAVFQDDRGTGGYNTNLNVTIPLPLWNRNQGEILRAEATAAAAEQAVDRVALDLQMRLATAYQRYDSATNQVDKYLSDDGILDSASQTLKLIQQGYQADEFTVLDLLNAQRTYSQANLAYLDALRELWISIVEIRGMLLRDSLAR